MKGSTRKYVDRKCLCSTKFVLMKKCCQDIYIYTHIVCAYTCCYDVKPQDKKEGIVISFLLVTPVTTFFIFLS